MGSEVRVRFAPSPTGYLHVGGARTALFNFLFARRHGGKFILRIEDTDRNRFQQGALEEIYQSLMWLGLKWDEGPEVGGEFGPYVQSERTELYRTHAQQLVQSGHAYYCFCTPERLAKVREEREAAKMPTGYDRHCRNLEQADIKSLLDQGKPYVIRLKVPDKETISFEDAIRGDISYKSNVLDDLVLMKADGFPTYHLASVVDDHSMRISHVLRGDEWIASTPRHLLIYRAFGWQAPGFAHLPVILSPGGGKLSKRKGAASVMDYKQNGYLPEALFNFLALLGWNPGDDREKMTLREMIEAFSLEKISPKGSVFDEKKLDWMNGLYMQDRPVESIIDDVLLLWKQKGFIDQNSDKDDPYLKSVVALMKDRSKRINELAENSSYFFTDPKSYDEKAAGKHFFKGGAVSVLRGLIEKLGGVKKFDEQTLEQVYREYAESNEISTGKLIHPTRLAVSGVSFGPGLYEMLALIGKERVLSRMESAAVWIENNSEGNRQGR